MRNKKRIIVMYKLLITNQEIISVLLIKRVILKRIAV